MNQTVRVEAKDSLGYPRETIHTKKSKYEQRKAIYDEFVNPPIKEKDKKVSKQKPVTILPPVEQAYRDAIRLKNILPAAQMLPRVKKADMTGAFASTVAGST